MDIHMYICVYGMTLENIINLNSFLVCTRFKSPKQAVTGNRRRYKVNWAAAGPKDVGCCATQSAAKAICMPAK